MQANNAIYDKMYSQAKQQDWPGWGGRARIQRIDGVLPYNAPVAGKLIELGCGEGTRSRLHARQGYEVTGIDVSQVAIDRAIEQDNRVNPIRY